MGQRPTIKRKQVRVSAKVCPESQILGASPVPRDESTKPVSEAAVLGTTTRGHSRPASEPSVCSQC